MASLAEVASQRGEAGRLWRIAALVAVVLLAFGAGLLLSPAALGASGRLQRILGATAAVPYAGDAAALGPDCQVPHLDETALAEYGPCKVLREVCLDQNRIIVYADLPDGETYPYPIVDHGWLPVFVPGWGQVGRPGAEGSGSDILFPQVRRNSSQDRPDLLHNRTYSACFTPFIWASPWAVQFAEFYFNSFVPLSFMYSQRMFDRNIQLVPVLDGYHTTTFMQHLLRPFTNKEILPYNSASSRARALDPLAPRCYQRVAICGLKGMYHSRPAPKYIDPATNITMYDGDQEWSWYQPSVAGKTLVDYYRGTGELAPLEKDADTLEVVVGNRTSGVRLFRDLPQFLASCNAWVPPPGSGFRRARCRALSILEHNFFESLEALQRADVFIAHHGAELPNGFFMRWGSAVVEVRMKDFPEDWANVYFSSIYRTENNILYWQVRADSDESWKPARYEAEGLPHHNYVIERHTVLRWEQWQPILTRILEFRGPGAKKRYEQLVYPNDIRWLI